MTPFVPAELLFITLFTFLVVPMDLQHTFKINLSLFSNSSMPLHMNYEDLKPVYPQFHPPILHAVLVIYFTLTYVINVYYTVTILVLENSLL